MPLFLNLGQAGLGLPHTESKPDPSIKRAEIINLRLARALKHKAKPSQGLVWAVLRLAWSMSTPRSNTVWTTLLSFFFGVEIICAIFKGLCQSQSQNICDRFTISVQLYQATAYWLICMRVTIVMNIVIGKLSCWKLLGNFQMCVLVVEG